MIKIKILQRLINLLKRKKVQVPKEITKENIADLECTATIEDITWIHKKSDFEKKVDRLRAILIKTKKYRVRKKLRKRIMELE